MGKLILRGLFWKNMGRKVIAQELEDAKAKMRETCVRLHETVESTVTKFTTFCMAFRNK